MSGRNVLDGVGGVSGPAMGTDLVANRVEVRPDLMVGRDTEHCVADRRHAGEMVLEMTADTQSLQVGGVRRLVDGLR